MDGKRIQKYWSNEMQAMLDTYKQFQILIPAKDKNGAAHNGEDGRYVETLIREYLKRYLPRELEILTGFILRPAVKTGLKNKERKNDKDSHSTQLDILVYDSAKYPVFQRFGENVIVPPEGVIAIISVKKHLHDIDIFNEAIALKNASKLCHFTDNGQHVRGPFLALVSMDSFEKKQIITGDWIFNQLKKAYSKDIDYFDDLIGYIGSFNKWSIFKRRPDNTYKRGEYIFFNHSDEEVHMGFQFLLTGILSVYYDETRNFISRPGFTGFPSNRNCDKILGEIETKGITN